MAEPQTTYDRLYATQVFFFLALILTFNILVVVTVYPFLLEQPFWTAMQKERGYFDGALSFDLHETSRMNGDRVYNAIFVNSGLEKFVYDDLRKSKEVDIAAEALRDLSMFDQMIDNIFDYFLLLCYRFGFFIVAMTYLGWFIVALAIHGAVVRHRKRYGFGDTPILLNLWARATLAYAIPVTFLAWSLPFAMHPVALAASLVACVGGLAIFAFSLPKIA